MRSISRYILLALIFLSAPAGAKDFDAETFNLQNGLQVVVIPNHRAPVVTHMIWYKFGGGDERPGKSGTAHFLEHLMFKGTPATPDGLFSARVKKLGGNENAFTTHDYTAFYQNVPKSALPQMMEMEADRMKHLTLKASEVDSERQVIIEERRQRIDNKPEARLSEQMMSALFMNHAYATPVIGWLHEMETLNQADVMESYQSWYAPNNAILVVSGDITAAELKPLAEKYYGVLPRSDLPARMRSKAAPLVATARLVMRDQKVGMPVVTKIWRAPKGSGALEMLAEIFGGSSTARLYKDLVVDDKLAVSAGAEYDSVSLDETTFTVYASPAPGVSIEKLEAAIDAEVAMLVQKGVTQDELKTARDRKKASLTYYLDSLQGPAMLFGRTLVSGFNLDYVENWSARLDKLGVADVNKAAAEVFSIPVTGILLPEKKS